MPTNHKRHNPAPRNSPNDVAAAPEQPATTTTETPDMPRPQPPPQPRRGEGLNIGELKEMSIQKLTQIAKELNVACASRS
jgi:hypothetical protein